MTKIQIELSDATAEAALAAGLLTSQSLEHLLSYALRRRQAVDYLLGVAEEVAAAGILPMSADDLHAEIHAARENRRKRADSH